MMQNLWEMNTNTCIYFLGPIMNRKLCYDLLSSLDLGQAVTKLYIDRGKHSRQNTPGSCQRRKS